MQTRQTTTDPDELGPCTDLGFGHLLKRYLLPVGLCAVPRGDVFLSHATLERNKDVLKRWMPHYAKVHTVLAGLLLTLCNGAQAAEASGWIVAATAVPAVGEVGLAISFCCVALVLRLSIR